MCRAAVQEGFRRLKLRDVVGRWEADALSQREAPAR